MQIRKVLALRGPNLWANNFPVLEAWVDLEELKDSPSDSLPGFNDRLMAWLPSMVEHRCSIGERGGFFERLRRGTWMGHILEHVTLELQELASGIPTGFGRARETDEDGVYRVVVRYHEEALGRACLQKGLELCLAAVYDRPFQVQETIAELRDFAHRVCFGPSTAAIVNAAKARGIPTRRLNDASLVQLGYGAQQRRIWTAETDQTSAIAQEIAQDKDLTRALLHAVGVPVPEGRPVESADDAWLAAQEIGGPVVVKPRYGNQGRGVTTNLTTEEQVKAAYANAAEIGSVVVEQCAQGDDYRLLVVGGQLVAAARRDPAHVVGDGRSTIQQLIDEANKDPRRGDHHATALSKMYIDAVARAVLAEQGFTADSIPAAGVKVLIRRNANLSTGGTATDVTEEVHPDVAARAIDAARVVGLDIAGIDIVAQDITRPLEHQGALVVEVNAGPGLRMHLEPSAGTPRPVGEAIVEMLFPDGQNGRIPIVAVTGVNGKTTTTRLVAHILRQAGKFVGMTCTDGIYLNDRRMEAGDCSGPQSARSVLTNPRVEAAVLETARGGILREGLGFDKSAVSIVTNIGEGDHLGLHLIDTPEQLAYVKRTVVDNVLPEGTAVLKADDPLVAQMAPFCKGSVCFFARNEQHPVITEHRARGGKAIFVRDGMIVRAEGERELPLVPIAQVPLTHKGRIPFQVENVLAAAAAAWALGIADETICEALRSFDSTPAQVPGRFNVIEACGSLVVIDYAHNPSALDALVEALDQLPHSKRAITYTVAGDRRDEDMIRQAQILGETFDRVHLYEEKCNRGRPDGAIVALMKEGLATSTRVAEVTDTRGELTTIELALRMLDPGELLVIQPDAVEEILAFVDQFIASGQVGKRNEDSSSERPKNHSSHGRGKRRVEVLVQD